MKTFSPYYEEISYQDPLRALAHFSQQNGFVLLDSSLHMPSVGRYCFIGIDPFQTLVSKSGGVELNGKKLIGDPILILEQELLKYSLSHEIDVPFQGGVVGYFGYDLYHHLEKINTQQIDDMQFPDLVLGFYDLVIVFDVIEKRMWIFSSGFPLLEENARKNRSRERFTWLWNEIANIQSLPPSSSAVLADEEIQSNFTHEKYMAAVEKVQEYILAGDIFEANISQRFSAQLPDALSSFDLYQRLRKFNPAPFSAYMNFNEVTLISASPERFLKLTGDRVETRPIKGTRRRGKNIAEDEQLAKELLASEKDRAENIMIVDLLRNDLSRVCCDFTVEVAQLCGIESYATVHHLVSVVTGKLQNDMTAVDLLRATFPGGSITGAPKIRAMEIIAELETTTRGPYCGSIGYLGFNGDMDTSIAIRTFAIKNKTVTFQAGGAVVLDSDPVSEYEETLTKSKALRRALCESIVD